MIVEEQYLGRKFNTEFEGAGHTLFDAFWRIFVICEVSKLDASAGFPVAFLSSVKAMASINRASMSCEERETPDGMNLSEGLGL